MPRPWHLQLWSTAARLVLPQGRYAALLVSLHGTGLYQSVDLTKETPEMAQAVQDYLVRERAFQEELKRTLRTDSYYAPYAAEPTGCATRLQKGPGEQRTSPSLSRKP
jgi:hypothetical protein